MSRPSLSAIEETTKRILLRRHELYASIALGQCAFANKPEVIGVALATEIDEIHVQIRQLVVAQDLADREVRYPRDWWQAFKARWFPAWALRRWPVEETVVTFEVRALYPKVALPRQEHYLMVDFQRDREPL